jgi:hypothetical protein
MGFFDDFVGGLGNALVEGGKYLELRTWVDTLQDDGVQMLQVKVRNYLREASDEEKLKTIERLKVQMGAHQSDLELRVLYRKVYEVYVDQMS